MVCIYQLLGRLGLNPKSNHAKDSKIVLYILLYLTLSLMSDRSRLNGSIQGFVMFSEWGVIFPILKIASLEYIAKYWVWNAKQYLHACYISPLFCIHTCLFERPIYISTTSSQVDSSSTTHFNICVCWLEICVRSVHSFT